MCFLRMADRRANASMCCPMNGCQQSTRILPHRPISIGLSWLCFYSLFLSLSLSPSLLAPSDSMSQPLAVVQLHGVAERQQSPWCGPRWRPPSSCPPARAWGVALARQQRPSYPMVTATPAWCLFPCAAHTPVGRAGQGAAIQWQALFILMLHVYFLTNKGFS